MLSELTNEVFCSLIDLVAVVGEKECSVTRLSRKESRESGLNERPASVPDVLPKPVQGPWEFEGPFTFKVKGRSHRSRSPHHLVLVIRRLSSAAIVSRCGRKSNHQIDQAKY